MVCHHRSGLSPGLLFVAAAEAVGPAVVVYEDLVRLSKAFQKQFFKAPTPSKRSLNSGLLFISGKQAKALAPVRGYFLGRPAKAVRTLLLVTSRARPGRFGGVLFQSRLPHYGTTLPMPGPQLQFGVTFYLRAPAPIRGYFLPRRGFAICKSARGPVRGYFS